MPRYRQSERADGDGCEDVVASVDPIQDDQPDIPAHWSVTFAVDDPDTAAAKTAELGGTVIAPPLDAPWSRPGYYRVRLTALKDPQGATFMASQFVPEN